MKYEIMFIVRPSLSIAIEKFTIAALLDEYLNSGSLVNLPSAPKETNVSDDVFADFGSSIEISDDDIAF